MTRQSYKISRNICEITEHGLSRFFLFHYFEIGDTVAGHQFISGSPDVTAFEYMTL